MWMSKEELIERMRLLGYYYDEINSYDEWIIFHVDFCEKGEFDSWQEVFDWYLGVCD